MDTNKTFLCLLDKTDDEGGNYDGKQTVKMAINKFDIPIHIGGMYDFSSDTRLFLEVGPYISYAISGNKKYTGYYTEYDDIHSSETEQINKKEKIGKGSLKDFQKFGYGLSATAGVSFKNIILQFTYQRGLNKTIKKKNNMNKICYCHLDMSFNRVQIFIGATFISLQGITLNTMISVMVV